MDLMCGGILIAGDIVYVIHRYMWWMRNVFCRCVHFHRSGLHQFRLSRNNRTVLLIKRACNGHGLYGPSKAWGRLPATWWWHPRVGSERNKSEDERQQGLQSAVKHRWGWPPVRRNPWLPALTNTRSREKGVYGQGGSNSNIDFSSINLTTGTVLQWWNWSTKNQRPYNHATHVSVKFYVSN